MLYYKKISSPLGEITLRSAGERLTGLWFADDKHYGDKDIQDAQNAELPVFARAEKWLAEYFAGCEPKVNVPLQFTGSDFQKSVWKILQKIPYGTLITYGDIACEIAAQRGLARMSAQAVGGAVGRNPLCIIIPCHRVIGADSGWPLGGCVDRWQLSGLLHAVRKSAGEHQPRGTGAGGWHPG